MNHAEMLRRFAEQIPNRRGLVEHRGSNFFCDVDDRRSILFSFGHHFPLAVYLGKCFKDRVFFKNGDHYSSYTSAHQSATQRVCKGPTVSFSTLDLAGVDALRVFLFSADVAASEVLDGTGRAAAILDYTEDGWTSLQRADPESPWQARVYGDGRGGESYLIPWARPRVGMLIPEKTEDGGPALRADWHTLGAVLLRAADGRSLLATSDEGTYCVIQLSAPARTVAAALSSLQPGAVKQARAHGREVRRQGEWYAIPRPELTDRQVADLLGLRTLRGLRQRSKQAALPRRFIPEPHAAGGFRPIGAEHVLPYVVTPRALILGRGSMFHRPGRAGLRQRADHRPLRLGAVWHQIEHNTEAASWTAAPGRRFD